MSANVLFRNLDFLGFPKYEVGTDGSVWTLQGRTRRPLKPTRQRGYYHVVLCNNRRKTTFYVHVLVLRAFVGPCPDGMECRHDNGDRGDNRLANLLWGTALENAADRDRHGTTSRGEKSGMARLSETEVSAIRSAFDAGETKAAIARRLGVHHSTVCCVAKGKTWKHAGGRIQQADGRHCYRGRKHHAAVLTESEVSTIRAAVAGGETQRSVAKSFGVSFQTVSKIVRGERWKHLTQVVTK